MAMKESPEKEKLRKRIRSLDHELQHVESDEEVKEIIQIRDGLQRELNKLRIMDLVPVDVEGFFCDSEIMI